MGSDDIETLSITDSIADMESCCTLCWMARPPSSPPRRNHQSRPAIRRRLRGCHPAAAAE